MYYICKEYGNWEVNMKRETLCKLGLTLVAITWGSGFPITKIALDSGIAPNAIMSIRFLVASMLIFIFFIFFFCHASTSCTPP